MRTAFFNETLTVLMNLNFFKRSQDKGSRTLRREGFIPAIIYQRGNASTSIFIPTSEFSTVLRHIVHGRLATTRFTLTSEEGNKVAVIKEIQYHPTTYSVLHIDFEELIEGSEINVKVPIEFLGAADCPGVKLGGVLRHVIRGVRVRCLPHDLPEVFTLDVSALGMKDTKRLSDLSIPNTVRPLADLSQVVVVVAKK